MVRFFAYIKVLLQGCFGGQLCREKYRNRELEYADVGPRAFSFNLEISGLICEWYVTPKLEKEICQKISLDVERNSMAPRSTRFGIRSRISSC
jgi:hypothetical protein